MTPDQFQAVAPLVAIGVFVLALLVFLFSLRYFRKSRTDFYWRRRRAAGQRGWRLFVWSLVLTLTAGLLCLFTGISELINARVAPTSLAGLPTSIETDSLLVASTETATATLFATASATSSATNSATPTSTATALPTASPTTAVTLPATLPVTLAATSPATLPITESATSSVDASTTFTATIPPTLTVLAPSATDTEIATQSAVVIAAGATQALATAATETTTPNPSPTEHPSPTPTDTVTAIDTATYTDTPTITLTSTVTPSQTLVPELLTKVPLESSVTPSADAKFVITALDTQISANYTPVTPNNTFTAGFKRVYFFVNFAAMQNGVLWRRQLLYNGDVIEDSAYLWGIAQRDGSAYFFFGQQDGFKSGSYEIRLYIGETDTPIATALFTVK